MHTTLSPRRELLLLLSLAGIQFTHIVDFMIMMPLGPQITQQFGIGDAAFGFLVSSYTWAAAISGAGEPAVGEPPDPLWPCGGSGLGRADR